MLTFPYDQSLKCFFFQFGFDCNINTFNMSKYSQSISKVLQKTWSESRVVKPTRSKIQGQSMQIVLYFFHFWIILFSIILLKGFWTWFSCSNNGMKKNTQHPCMLRGCIYGQFFHNVILLPRTFLWVLFWHSFLIQWTKHS